MTRQRKILYFPAGAMEFCWLYAWVHFLGLAVLGKAVPFTEALAVFALAAFLNRFSSDRGWRIIRIRGMQFLGFLLIGMRLIHFYYAGSFSFFNYHWFLEWWRKPKTVPEWFACLFILFCGLLLWWAGARLHRRALTRPKIKIRFDLGLAAFFLLFLVKLIAQVKGGSLAPESMSLALVFPFLFSGLGLIGLMHNRQATWKNFQPGYRSWSVVLGFTLTVFLCAIGLAAFFYPSLILTAERGSELAGRAFGAVGPALMNILRFMIIGGNGGATWNAKPQEPATVRLPDTVAENGGWVRAIEEALIWGLWGLLALGLVLVLAFIVRHWFLPWFLRLVARTAFAPRERPMPEFLSRWALLLDYLLLRLKRVKDWARGYTRMRQVYGALLRWGRLSNAAPRKAETPREYGSRLGRRFQKLSADITVIVEAFQKEVYAETSLTKQERLAVRRAWRCLCSPLRWPMRIKSWVRSLPQSELQAK